MFVNNSYNFVYSRTFRAFLAQTDEKEVLLRAIKTRIRASASRSVLDIGAGGGDLAVPLSRNVKHYVAVEQSPIFARRLQAGGIAVINSFFPCAIPGTFDIVLACHSVPRKRSEYEPFIDGALNCVSKTGQFLLVTHDDRGGAWEELLCACDLEWPEREENRFTELWSVLNQRGEPVLFDVTTHLRSGTIEQIMDALSFLFGNGNDKHVQRFLMNAKVRSYVQQRHSIDAGYGFPIKQLLVQLQSKR